MADKAIKRDTFETLETAGLGAAKGALGGVFVAFAAAAIPVAIVGALFVGGLAAMGVVGAALTTSIVIAGGLAVAAGIGSGMSLGVVSSAAGGLFGLMRGASKVERENALYASKMNEARGLEQANAMQMAYQTLAPQVEQATQQAYAAGEQSGAQKVLTKLQEHAALAQNSEQPKQDWAKNVTERREQSKAAEAQIG